MFKILVTSKSFAKYEPELISELEKNNIQIVRPVKDNMTSKEIAEIIESYDGIVCGIDSIDEEVIEAGKKLKIIHMHGTGTDHIDIDAATKRNIYVGSCPGMNATAVAELNLAILLAEARKIILHSNLIYDNKWERYVGVELSNKTIGVIGLGYIGKRFVELLKGFDMKVLAYEPCPDIEWVKEHNVEIINDLETLFKESHFISLNLPLLESTQYIINEKAFKVMRKDAIIINSSRGGLIDTKELIKAIKNKQIKGAALDTFEIEPLEKDSKLLDLGITLTPHLGASTIDTVKKVSRQVAKNLQEVLVHNRVDIMINSGQIEKNKESEVVF